MKPLTPIPVTLTRFPELGICKVYSGLWRVVARESASVPFDPYSSCLGSSYRTKGEALADLERYASEYGATGAAPYASEYGATGAAPYASAAAGEDDWEPDTGLAPEPCTSGNPCTDANPCPPHAVPDRIIAAPLPLSPDVVLHSGRRLIHIRAANGGQVLCDPPLEAVLTDDERFEYASIIRDRVTARNLAARV